MKKSLLAIVVLFSLCSYAHSYQITLQPGSEGIDTSFGSGGDYYPDSGVMHMANLEDNGYIYRALIKFDLSSVVISEVDSAILYLNFIHSVLDGQQKEVYIHRVIDSWDESTATWLNQPGVSTDGVVTKLLPASGTSLEAWDITHMVNDWIDGTYQNYGMQITTEYAGNYNKHIIRSSDAPNPDDRPELILTVEDNPVPEPVTIFLFITGLIGINLRNRFKK